MHARLPFLFVAAAVGLACGAIGCNTKKTFGKVSGVVTMNGSHLTQGEVNFMSNEGVGATTKIDASGRFSFDEPLETGNYHVAVTPLPPTPTDPSKGPPPKMTDSKIPEKARSTATSGLQVEVKEGMNELPIDVKE